MDARIDRLQRETASRPGALALGGGLPSSELFPLGSLARSFLAALKDAQCPALQYGWPEGDEQLRAWIAERLRARGASVAAEDIIVTSGAQQAIAIATDILCECGTRVGVDDETYPAALDLFRARGATLVSASAPADWSYVIPGVDNPRGLGLTTERRRSLVEGTAPFIADEAYAELRFDGVVERPLLIEARARAWHVGTLSKTVCPGLRVGWLVPPPTHLQAARNAKRDRDLQASSLTQAVAHRMLSHVDFDARLVRARRFYRRRADALMRALRRRLPSWSFREPEGGFSVFVETDLVASEVALLECAARHGVGFDPGGLFRREEVKSPIAMRLCFSSVGPRELDEGVRRLERAARELTRQGVRGSLG